MTVEITQVNSCRKDLTGTVPVEEFEREVEIVALEYSRKANIPGFRPGKAPVSVVRRRFEKEIQDEVSQRIIDRTWQEAADANDFAPIEQPRVKVLENEFGNPMKFTLTFEEVPPLEIKEYKGVEVVQEKVEISDEDVSQVIDEIRGRSGQLVPVDGVVEDGHYVTANVDSLSEGKKTPQHQEDVTLIVGHPQSIAEFSENLRGAKVDDTLSFDVCYPDDHGNAAVAGKKVMYTVLVKEIKERQLPDLNDDFAKDAGYESVDALRAGVRADMTGRTGENAEKKAREKLLDSIIERQPVDVPDALVAAELGTYAQNLLSDMAYRGLDIEQTAGFDWKKIYDQRRPFAEQSVRRMLVLNAVADQENIEVSEEDISRELEIVAEQSQKSANTWRAELEKANRMGDLKQRLLWQKTLDFIYLNANIRVE